MNGLNFQASVSNLTQMDRHQHDAHRAPVENQEQNAQRARDEAAQRLVMTVRVEEAAGKRIDPGQRRGDNPSRKKNRKKEGGAPPRARGSGGRLLDIEA
jgi:hypothetical protein